MLFCPQQSPHLEEEEEEEEEDLEYRGEWREDLPHGAGVMQYSSGQVRSRYHRYNLLSSHNYMLHAPTSAPPTDFPRLFLERTPRGAWAAAGST
jgi:hypothetical protein